MRLIECVPNFSEGRDQRVIDAIAQAAESVEGVRLLDVDPGAATNRTVFTFAGAPEAVVEAAFQAIAKGVELIDMRQHKGEHARHGACDVCPFVPISGVSMAECVELAERLAARVGRELQLPVYLYADAARKPERKRLPDIRAGEYEALPAKLRKKEWKPDFGPAKFNAKAGVVAIGARNFLIAYNINLNTPNVKLAKKIAFEVRERGKLKRDADQQVVRRADGTPERVPGLFKAVQGTGWLIPEYHRAQVTVNILDIDSSPVHKVYDACCELATQFGARVTGSEVVGMVPKRVLIDAGRYFLKKQGASTGVSEAELVRTAVLSLGLTDVSEFDPQKKIIEDRFKQDAPLAAMSLGEFADELASSSPAPGGGSVAALAGSLAAGLAAMVSALTYDKKGFARVREEMEDLAVRAQELKSLQLGAIDGDTAAFNKVMEAMRLPKKSNEEQAVRGAALDAATKDATLVPLATLDRTLPTLDLALDAAVKGNPNSLSDAGVSALMARACAWGAYLNVLINLDGIADRKWCARIKRKADTLLAEADKRAKRVENLVLKRLRPQKKKKTKR
jgi:glutamate formiminotransferase/formiminotetrahydrofolate cyclodeaminase